MISRARSSAKMRKLDPPPSEQKFFDDLVDAVSGPAGRIRWEAASSRRRNDYSPFGSSWSLSIATCL